MNNGKGGILGRTLKVDVTPYHILDVMKDPAYMPHFVRRFHIHMEKTLAKGKVCPYWAYYYRNNPRLLYDDCLDEIKYILQKQKSSASSFELKGALKNIVLEAASDWITEKTHRVPEFEVFPNTVKSARINLEHYGLNIEKRRKEKSAKANSDVDMGCLGTSSLREESDGGNENS